MWFERGGRAEEQEGRRAEEVEGPLVWRREYIWFKSEDLNQLLTFSLSYTSHSLTPLTHTQKKGGTELALGTPKTPKNQLKTMSFCSKTDLFLNQTDRKHTLIDKLYCYVIHINMFFYLLIK